MIEDPYEEFKREEMILRDWLALDRTVLANKRTFLAYCRTALALVALGIAFLKWSGESSIKIGGIGLMVFGIIIFIVGTYEFIGNKSRFKLLIEKEKYLEEKLTGDLGLK